LNELALHYREGAVGGDEASAVTYATLAGNRAAAALAYEQAAAYYTQALALMTSGTQSALHRRELLFRLGEAQRDAGDASFRETLLSAAADAAAHGDSMLLARAALANNRGWASAGVVDHERIAALDAALQVLDPADGPIRARVLAALVLELTYSDDDRLRTLDRDAVAMARRLGDPATLTDVLRTRYNAIWTPDTLGDRLATTAELVTLAEQLDDPFERYIASNWRMYAALDAGDIVDVDRHLLIEHALVDELGRPRLRWTLALQQSWRSLLARAQSTRVGSYVLGAQQCR
jgi:hypothetical protein